jgi:hypothetical protein
VLESGAAAITDSVMWPATGSTSGSSPAPIESSRSRSVTIPGVGASSSITRAAPTLRATIAAAAWRSVCDGPTVTDTSDMPSLTCIAASSLDEYSR